MNYKLLRPEMAGGSDRFLSYTIVRPGADLVAISNSLKEKVSSLRPKGLLVKVHAAGVCHTDVHQWSGGYNISGSETVNFTQRAGYGYPKVPGHEISGTVYALGSALASEKCILSVGDRVAVFPWIGCDECEACDDDAAAYCTGQAQEIGMCTDGGYAEYVALPHYKYAVKLPDGISYDLASTLGCSGLTAYNALATAMPCLANASKYKPKAKLGVVGVGGLGQWTLSLAKNFLSIPNLFIVGCDVDSNKLDRLAREGLLDSTVTMDRTQPVEKLVSSALSRCGGELDAVIDFVNVPLTFNFSVRLLGRRGVLVPVGLHGSGCGEVPTLFLPLHKLSIIGVQVGNLADFKEVVAFVGKHQEALKMPLLVKYSFSDCSQALKDLDKGTIAGRAILQVS